MRVHLSLPARGGNLATLRELTRAWAAAAGADPGDWELMVTELVANAVEHGTGTRVEVEMFEAADAAHLVVSNESAPLPGGLVRAPFPRNDLPGGRGLEIVRSVASSMQIGHDAGRVTIRCSTPVARAGVSGHDAGLGATADAANGSSQRR